jgi:hypothetical protein
MFYVMHNFMNIGNCLRFVGFVCVYVSNVIDACTIVRAASDDERSTNKPDARWGRCKELRTSQCVVSHTAPFCLPLGVCHVVTCLCLVAFVGMLLRSFLFASYFVYCYNVCVYIC